MKNFAWRQSLRQLLLATAATLQITAAAGQVPEAGSDLPVRYAVELLVFENLDRSRATPEVPLPRSPETDRLPNDSSAPAGRTLTKSDEVSFLLLDLEAPPAEFSPLPADAYALTSARERLERLDAYRPILHTGWIQQARDRSSATSLRLGVQLPTVAGLDGEITLYQERFIHLVVELVLAEPGNPAWTDTESRTDSAQRISESRRLKDDLLQYFDNPNFGLIASVRELQPPEDATTEP